jgi:sugar lactone lactonase YvrE
MELAMDRDGVYWVDRGAGEVWEWRRDGVKFPLARSVSSNGIAVDASFVYFTDNSSGGSVKRIAK